MSHKDKVEKCPKCGKEFIVRLVINPSNCDDNRKSYVDCPYCGEVLEKINLMKNEDVFSIKKEK